ncbi:hypothetical protein [Alienimonas sp. DA493]|uniref:multiheme c-type cytochrome n=1 Tax=Alienimonas sp. DA493 TaxID=3373605 RepID=UPI00375522FC
MRRHAAMIAGLIAVVGGLLAWFVGPSDAAFRRPNAWQRMSSPGALSAAHAHLERDCAACHTPVTGVTRAQCVACHANDKSILNRQPTAFHADVGSCVECHREHRGTARRPTDMDHTALARLGLRQWEAGDGDSTDLRRLVDRTTDAPPPYPHVTAQEAALDCAACHSNDDRHFGFFGADCARCHATEKWTIPEFRHPSPSSVDCAQCHQAPPSHYMMHFHMVSAHVAGKPHARVEQCFQCHQTTSWNDIQNVGWYKHH